MLYVAPRVHLMIHISSMSQPKAFLPTSVPSWSAHDVQRLKQLAASGLPIETIATTLNRTPSSIRNKAGMHGISLRKQSIRPEPVERA